MKLDNLICSDLRGIVIKQFGEAIIRLSIQVWASKVIMALFKHLDAPPPPPMVLKLVSKSTLTHSYMFYMKSHYYM